MVLKAVATKLTSLGIDEDDRKDLHVIIPSITGSDISNEPAFPGALFRMPDRLTPMALFWGSAHGLKDAPVLTASATSRRLSI